MDEKALVQRAIDGDSAAFGTLVERYQQQVFNLALRMVGSRADAEDLAQEAFIRAWRALPSFHQSAQFSTWLYRLTSNICIDFLRSQKRKKTISLTMLQDDEDKQWDLPDGAPLPEQRMIDREEREALLEGDGLRSFFTRRAWQREEAHYQAHPEELDKLRAHFVGLTEGLSFTELMGLRTLCVNEDIPVHELASVVDLYKFGIRENPWNHLDHDRLAAAEETFRRRVKGQEYAVQRTMDVIKRAAIGLGNLQSSSTTKPKGILFFAGPTGTGKTETAKTRAEALFGDERCCIRFDMSEYRQSHSDQRLLGAPPGYVGYEAGGQLTNAVRDNPFSILLFDEIEKAHPSILDKFLQILEDGRMTDGKGNTVYFTETVIVFTSNLGFHRRDIADGRIAASPEMDYATLRHTIHGAIEEYFKLELGRPELLNRIGENIIVFDYIRPDTAAAILDAQVEKIARRMSEDRSIRLTLYDGARETLLHAALQNLSNGGRGVGNIVESMLINPLSRFLFDNRVEPGGELRVRAIRNVAGNFVLDASVTDYVG